MSGLDDRIDRLPARHRRLLEAVLDEARDDPLPGRGSMVAPRDDLETTLVEVWEEVLGVRPVGVTDDYVELGGDSIVAIVVVARALEAGVAITGQDLFELGTIDRIARVARPHARLPAGTAGVSPEADGLPLTPMQEGMLFHTRTGDRPGRYVVLLECVLDGPVDVSAFERAWRSVVARHPALRSYVVWDGEQAPRQFVAGSVGVDLPVLDHRHPGEDPAVRRSALVQRERDRGIEVDDPPLMRLVLIREDETRHRFLWTHHHLVLDGWSQQLVLRELFESYRGADPDPSGVDDGWVEYLRGLDRPGAGYVPAGETGPDAESTSAHWRRRLTGVVGSTVAVAAAGGGGERRMEIVGWPAATVARLRDVARSNGLTEATVVSAAWGLALARFLGRDEVVFGTTLTDRPARLPRSREAVGLFLATVPTRVACPNGGSVRDWLTDLQRDLAADRGYAGAPLYRIARAAGAGAVDALFDTILVVENFPAWVGEGTRVADLVVRDVRVTVDEGYPLVLEVASGDGIVLRARHDVDRVPVGSVRRLLDLTQAAAEALVEETDLSEVVRGVAVQDEQHLVDARRLRAATAASRLRPGARRSVPTGPDEATRPDGVPGPGGRR